MDGKFHSFDIFVTVISSVYEMPHRMCMFSPHPNPLPQAGEGTDPESVEESIRSAKLQRTVPSPASGRGNRSSERFIYHSHVAASPSPVGEGRGEGIRSQRTVPSPVSGRGNRSSERFIYHSHVAASPSPVGEGRSEGIRSQRTVPSPACGRRLG
ncbi:hypothetical protein PMI17_04312 [Pantoea sp. GM01]|nr:hypothetical protein PMI17_04312 [Pantoea sp. GM01]